MSSIFAVFVWAYVAWLTTGLNALSALMTFLALASLATPTSDLRAKCMFLAVACAAAAVLVLAMASYLLPLGWAGLVGFAVPYGFVIGVDDRQYLKLKRVAGWVDLVTRGTVVVAALILIVGLRLGATGEQMQQFLTGRYSYFGIGLIGMVLAGSTGLTVGVVLGARSARLLEGVAPAAQRSVEADE